MIPIPFELEVALFGALCLCAVSYDLIERRIPDALNYGLILLGAAFGINAAGTQNALGYAGFVAFSFAFAYAIYKAGAWAGGDVKFFTALCAFLPAISPRYSVVSPLALFLISAALLAPVTLLAHWGRIKPKEGWVKRAGKALEASLPASLVSAGVQPVFYLFSANIAYVLLLAALLYVARIPAWLSVPAFAASLLAFPNGGQIASAAYALAILSLVSMLIRCYPDFSAALRRSVPVGELKPGDIPAQTIVVHNRKPLVVRNPGLPSLLRSALAMDATALKNAFPGKEMAVADSMRAMGLAARQIEQLKKLGVKSIYVKESLPYAPVILAAYPIVWWLV
ncbi:prepilin peptidase [Candidatus Micrarchaeota archaeon]|nr:prepilin peptidase [Candidatus Micrarchaeota archaeon]